eukprot:437143_1
MVSENMELDEMFENMDEMFETTNEIFKTATNIKKLSLTIAPFTCFEPESLEDLIIELITSCKHLEYFNIMKPPGVFGSILYGVLKALHQTTKIKREKLKIDLGRLKDTPTEFILCIVNIIHSLEMSEIKDFMCIFTVEKCFRNILENKLKDMLSMFNVTVNKRPKNYEFIITNKNCQLIKTSRETWKLWQRGRYW